MKKFSGLRKAIGEQTLSLSEKTQHWHSFSTPTILFILKCQLYGQNGNKRPGK
jgi:hypothetical protein